MKRLLLLLLTTTRVALGQSDDSTTAAPFPPKSDFRSGVLVEFSFSQALTSVPAIRSFFRANQIEADSRTSSFINTGLGYRRRRFKGVFRLENGVDPSANTYPNAIFVARRQNISALELLLGFDIANTRNQRVYINAGYGRIRYEYAIYRPTTQVVLFQDILQNSAPGSVPSLVLNNDFWDISLEMVQREKRKEGIQLVSRIGYRRGVQRSPWASDAYQIVGGPVERINQFYLQFGAFLSRNHNRRSKQ